MFHIIHKSHVQTQQYLISTVCASSAVTKQYKLASLVLKDGVVAAIFSRWKRVAVFLKFGFCLLNNCFIY